VSEQPVYEVVENFDGELSVVGRYYDYEQAKRAAMQANMASAPVEPGDIWGPDYFARPAG
jgi:hypothetical protein